MVWSALLALLLLTDLVLSPLAWIVPYDFDFSKCWSAQVKEWSLNASLADWLFVVLIRDLLMLTFLVCGGKEKEGTASAEAIVRSCQPLRRVATAAVLIGVLRFVLVDWGAAGADDVSTVGVFTAATSIGAMVISYFRGFARDAADKAQVDFNASMITMGEPSASLSASVTADQEEEQYKSSLSLLQMITVMKPYFWPSSGTGLQRAIRRFLALFTWVCVIGSKSSNLAAPLFLAKATNGVSRALSEGTTTISSDVVMNILIYAFLGLSSKGLKELQSFVYIPVQRTAYIEIADFSFAHIHSLSLDWHLRKKMGNVIRSLQRGLQAAQQTMQYIFLYLIPTIAEGIAVVLIFLLHFRNASLAVLVFINLWLYCYVTVKITIWRKKFRSDMAKKDNEMNDRLADSLVNYETIKYFTAEKYECAEYRRSVTQFQQGSMLSQASMNMLNVLQQLIIYVTVFGGLTMSAVALVRDQHDLGEFVAVNAYITQVFGPLSFLGTIYNMAINALIDMHSFGQLIAETSDVKDESTSALDLSLRADPMIEYKDVYFNYRSQPELRSVKALSFQVPRGNMTALVGTTGAGKTTITRLLFRFYDPVKGTVCINGQNLRSVTQHTVRKAIGMVPQDVVMFNASIRHNLLYGRIDEADDKDIERAAEQAQLMEFITQQPDGMKTVVGERGLKLSGGEKQRLAIARCLVKNPPIVVLDEATSALDSATEQRVQEALKVLSQDRTVIAIAHRLSTVKDFDEILVLEHGEVVESGTHRSLLDTGSTRYSGMWNRQAAGVFDGDPNQVEGIVTTNGK